MADVEFKLKGVDEVRKRLQALPKELQLKPARSALGKAATVVRKQAQVNALRFDDPDTGRRIADNIIQRFRGRYYKRTGDLMVSVGVGTEKGRIPKGNPDTGPKGNTPHWHLLELGSEKMRAQPFLRPAAEEVAPRVMDAFTQNMNKAIDQITRKLAKK
ncbi:MAG: HK97 gp10 family phage protein [Comamonas sp.]|jgi:HK97 gp10 family phage protein|nr:HK97 gp10 family phage protein [Comamonas sp.]